MFNPFRILRWLPGRMFFATKQRFPCLNENSVGGGAVNILAGGGHTCGRSMSRPKFLVVSVFVGKGIMALYWKVI